MNSDVEIAGDLFAVTHLLPPASTHPSTIAGFAGLARDIAADQDSWAPLVRYDAASRWYHRLRTGPGYEVWLLSWLPGQRSGAHSHGGSSGVLTVFEGELNERSKAARKTEAPGGRAGSGGKSLTLRPGSQRVITPGYVHEVSNDSLEPAVSLHIYFPGLTEMPMYGDHLGANGAKHPALPRSPGQEPDSQLTH